MGIRGRRRERGCCVTPLRRYPHAPVAPTLLLPVAVIGLLSLAVLIRLMLLAHKHKVPVGLLLNMAFQGYPIALLCKVKGDMEAWGLIIEMHEVLAIYDQRLSHGGKTYAAMEEDLRQGVIRARTGRGEGAPKGGGEAPG